MRLLTVLLFLVLAGTAQAENFSVKTTDANGFTPQELTVKPGDSVTFSNPTGGFHNVRWLDGTFDDGQQASPSHPSTIWPTDPTRTFSEEGTFQYYCEQHGTPQGGGMAGTVTVSSSTEPPDTEAPKVTGVSAGYRHKRPFVSFTLSEPARVGVIFKRRRAGRDRLIAVRRRSLGAGAQRIQLGRRELAEGRYYFEVAEALDAAGNSSGGGRAGFRVR